MKKKNNKELVTQSEFRQFTEGTFKQFVETQFDPFYEEFKHFKEVEFKNVFNKLSTALLKTQQDLNEMKQNMATKSDIKRILDRFDFYEGKNKIIVQEQGVQAFHIKELRETTQQHEIRISVLENNRNV